MSSPPTAIPPDPGRARQGPAAPGLVLAAGAGRRMGGPKALVRDTDGITWAERAARTLLDGGCGDVTIVIGAQASEARAALVDLVTTAPVQLVVAADWADGQAASLRAGLHAVAARAADTSTEDEVLVVVPVDVPGLPVSAVQRLIDRAAAAPQPTQVLLQATYGPRPGHPVVLGRAHWAAIAAQVSGDTGARGYLRQHGALQIDCADLWDGKDVDHRPGHPSA